MAFGKRPVGRGGHGEARRPHFRMTVGAVLAVALCSGGAVAAGKAKVGWLYTGVTYRPQSGYPATVGRPGPGSAQVPGDACVVPYMAAVTPVGRTLAQGTLVRLGEDGVVDLPYGDNLLNCSAGSLAFVPTLDARREWPTEAELDERWAAQTRVAAARKATWERAADQAVSCGKAGDCPEDAGE